MREALFYSEAEGKRVHCRLCRRRCSIPEGESGFCKVRINRQGKLFSQIYGKVASLAVSPIEKKPLYHFHPGSRWLSLGSFGCNFLCPGCQNWDIVHSQLPDDESAYTVISPEGLVKRALQHQCKGISWTYNEPTVWLEYALKGATLGKEKKLLTNFVTNGFMSIEALDAIGPFLDSFRVDVKGFSRETYKALCNTGDYEGVLHSTLHAKEKWGMHVEVVTNIVPGYSDKEEELRSIARWIAGDLGRETPWHVTRFSPHLHLSEVKATPLETLERACDIGREEGLLFVYLGNVPGHERQNTFCPACERILIRREGFDVLENSLREGCCPTCGYQVPGVF